MKPILERLNQNKTEAAYDELLRLRKLAGEIEDYRFEPFKLFLSHNVPGGRAATVYIPDFLVVFSDHFEVHEVKGFWREDAKVKIKMAAELFPWFKFIAVYAERGQWRYEEL